MIDHTTSQANSATVENAIRTLQNIPGKDYSLPEHQRAREQIAWNVHHGFDAFDGVR